jgi:hypothetical protein
VDFYVSEYRKAIEQNLEGICKPQHRYVSLQFKKLENVTLSATWCPTSTLPHHPIRGRGSNMYRVFGFLFDKPKGAILFLLVPVVFALAYHRVLQNSIRKHSDVTKQLVQDHCRYMVGKRLGKTPSQEISNELQSCKDLRVKSVESSGGVFNPVIVRITVEAQPSSPLDSDVFIFKTVDINTGHFNFLSGLNRLISGHWEFNYFNTYSDTTFHGSF